MRYQHRNPDIRAVEWGGSNLDEVREVLKGSGYSADVPEEVLHLNRRNRNMWLVKRGEWIVREGGDVRVLFPGVFHQRYQPISD